MRQAGNDRAATGRRRAALSILSIALGLPLHAEPIESPGPTVCEANANCKPYARDVDPSEWGRPFAPRLQSPISCDPHIDCWIANRVDLDPGPEAKDYQCGSFTYNGHDGTDFAIRDLAAMRRGIDVVAVAEGTVRGVRDGIPDRSVRDTGTEAVKKVECGNGVVIAHAEGWETQYCHLREGSVAVKPGQRVKPGEVLGKVGLSGLTEYPHLHFSVRHQGKAVDPFGGKASTGCGPGGTFLWAENAKRWLLNGPGTIYNTGIAPEEPTTEAIRDGRYSIDSGKRTSMGGDAAAMVFFVEVFGVRAGDLLTLRIDGPDGTVAKRKVTMSKYQARWTGYVGKRRTTQAWPPGRYRAEATLRNAGAQPSPLSDHEIVFDVR